VLGQQPEADQEMGLAATHRLLQMKDGLAGEPRQPCEALGDQVLHALGNVRFLEESRAIALGGDQFVQLFNLIAELDRQGVGLERAGVADSLHGCFRSRMVRSASPRKPRRMVLRGATRPFSWPDRRAH